MLYVNSKQEVIQHYWTEVIGKNNSVEMVDGDFFNKLEKIENDDIYILDIDQFENIEALFTYYKSIPKNLKTVAVLTEPKLAHGAFLIKKGFKSYLGKKTSKLIVEQAITTVKNDNVWLYPELMSYIIKHINIEEQENKASEVLEKLSQKEQEVANLVSEGLSNKEIASKLDVQLVTIKKHISSIFTKLDVKDRVALAILINS